MAWNRLGRGQTALASTFTASLLIGIGCTGADSGDVHFDPIGGSSTGASGGDDNSGGSKLGGAGTSSNGAQANAGSSSGGSGNNAGTSNAGTDAGGTNSAGSNAGGTDAGGTDAGGSAGSNGNAGSGGQGGSGTAGSGGSGGGPSCTPKLEVCDGVDNDCDKLVDPEDTCPLGCTGATYGGHVYYFCGEVDSASAALAKCTGYGMALVSIQSKAENDFVIGTIKGSSWLGASDEADEDHWTWLSTGTAFWEDGPIEGQYHNWQPGQPDNNGAQGADENCAVIVLSDAAASRGTWDDVVCSLDVYRATCESSGLVIGPNPQ